MWSSVATLAHAACCTWHHRQRTSHYRNRTSHYRSPNACKTPAGLSNHGPATARPKVSFSSPASLIRLGFLSPLRRFLPYLTTTRDPPQNVYAKRGASKARTYCRSKCRCGTVTRVVLNQRMHTSAFHGDAEAQLLVDKGFALFGYGSLVWKQGTLKVSSPRGGFINVSDCAPRLLVGDAGVHMI